mgnify:CR=1 FL=1
MERLSLTNVKNFLRKYGIWVGVVGFLILILVLILWSKIKSPAPGRIPKLEIDQSILFRGRGPTVASKIPPSALGSLPQKGGVFKLSPFPNRDAIATIAAKLSTPTNRGQNPDGELVFTGESGLLFYNPNTGSLRFNQRSLRKPAEQTSLTEEELIRNAKSFVFELGLYKTTDEEVVVLNKGYTILSGLEFTPAKDLPRADFLDLGFTKLLDRAPIIAQTPTLALTQVKISKMGEVALLEHIFVETQEATYYNLKTAEDLLKSLQRGEAFVIKISEEGRRLIELSSPYKLRAVEATSAAFGYFKDNSSSNLLQPVFKIEGTAKTEADRPADVVLILPAVASELILP